MAKILEGDIRHLNLNSKIIIQAEYKGKPQIHNIKPQKNGNAIIISAVNKNDGERSIIEKIDNPFSPNDTRSNRWAEKVISQKLKLMYNIITPAQQEYDNLFLKQLKQNVPILEYASRLGYTPVKMGNYYSLKEHDSVRISSDRNYFYRYSKSKDGHPLQGSIIDFMIEFDPNISNASQAVKRLSSLTHYDAMPLQKQNKENRIKKSQKLIMPELNNTMCHVIAYLTKSRCINKNIVQKFIDNKNLYEDKHRNCVFVSYNKTTGQPNFINLRGSNTYKKFQHDVPGCDYNNCFYIGNKAKSLIVTEAVIDTMSVMQIMNKHNRDLSKYNYLALSGTTKYASVFHHLKQEPEINTLVLALDNDNSGLQANQKIKEELKSINWNGKIIDYIAPNEKDWNAELQHRSKRFYNQDKISNVQDKQVKRDTQKELER